MTEYQKVYVTNMVADAPVTNMIWQSGKTEAAIEDDVHELYLFSVPRGETINKVFMSAWVSAVFGASSGSVYLEHSLNGTDWTTDDSITFSDSASHAAVLKTSFAGYGQQYVYFRIRSSNCTFSTDATKTRQMFIGW